MEGKSEEGKNGEGEIRREGKQRRVVCLGSFWKVGSIEPSV